MPYAPVVVLSDLDLHLFGEGTHRRLWELLGAHVAARRRCALRGVGAQRAGRWRCWATGTSGAAATQLQPQGSSGIWARRLPDARRPASATSSASRRATGALRAEGRPDGSPERVPAVERQRRRRRRPVRVGRRRVDGRRAAIAPGAPLRIYEVHLGSWRSGVDGYGEFGEQLADHVVGARLHPRRAAAGGRAPVRRLVGLPGHRLLRADGALRDARRPARDGRHAAPSGHRRDRRLGAGALPEGRLEPGPLRRHRAVRARRSAPGRAPRLGHATSSTTAATRCATSSSPTRCTGWTSSTSTACASTRWPACCTSTTRARPASGCPTATGGRENLEAIDFLRELNTVVAPRHPTAMVIAEESTSWPKVTHPVEHGGLGFTHKWNMGWMHDTLGYLQHDPVHRRCHHRELTFGLLYAFSERFVLPLSHDEVVHGKGSLLAQDAGRRLAALRQPARAVRVDVGAAGRAAAVHGRRDRPVHRVEREPPACRGTCWSTRRTAACRELLAELNRRRRRRGRRCTNATTSPPGSSGSTPTTPTTRCSRSCAGARRRHGGRRASPTSRRCRGPGTAWVCRGRASGRCCSTPTRRTTAAAASPATTWQGCARERRGHGDDRGRRGRASRRRSCIDLPPLAVLWLGSARP